MPPGGGIHTIKIRARLAQDLVGLPKLAVLAFQSLQLCRHIRGNTGARTTVALSLLHPLMQRMPRTADLGGDRRDRRPARGMLAFVIQNHSHRAGADLGRELVGRLDCHRSTFSGVGASDQPGAVQSRISTASRQLCANMPSQECITSSTSIRESARYDMLKRCPTTELARSLVEPSDVIATASNGFCKSAPSNGRRLRKI
jgi:hypothetical protein